LGSTDLQRSREEVIKYLGYCTPGYKPRSLFLNISPNRVGSFTPDSGKHFKEYIRPKNGRSGYTLFFPLSIEFEFPIYIMMFDW